MELNKNNFYRLIVLIILSITIYLGMQNIGSVIAFFQTIIKVIRPVIWGLVMAFILNVPMKNIEKHLFDHPFYFPVNKSYRLNKFIRKLKRPISLLLSLCIIFAIFAVIAFFVIPAVIETVGELLAGVPLFVQRIQTHLTDFINENPRLSDTLVSMHISWNDILDKVVSWVKDYGTLLISNTLAATGGIVSGVTMFILSLVLAIYILVSKETLQRQMNKLIMALLSEKKCGYIHSILGLANRTFSAYVSGQFLEACLLGLSTYIGMNIFNLPFSSLVGVIVAIFAMVPIVGAFISGAIGTLLVFTHTSSKAIIFAIFFIVLQQIDANLVYPHIVGKSVKLSGLWVLIAISVGGSIGGVLGILISIPIFSVVYTLLSQWVNNKVLDKEIKQMPQHWFDRTFKFFNEVNEDINKKSKIAVTSDKKDDAEQNNGD